jgi:serine/threonine protein kinase
MSADEIGRVGDFRILKALGEGGMGAVYLAEDTRLQRQVALKFLLPALAVSEHGKTRFLREARSAARIRHENVVMVYDVGEVQGIPYIAMERLKGTTLEGWLRKNGTPPVAQVVRIAKEILAGLEAAHEQGLVHRDIKPANIWLEAPKGKVRLLDFGLAVQPEGGDRVTSTGVIMGTAAYMSPEQARGEVVDPRSDLFSVGVVLYQLATGSLPFKGNSAIDILLNVCSHNPPSTTELNANIPAGLDRLIQQLIAKTPKARPQSAAEVIQYLSGPLATQSVSALPLPAPIDVPAAPSGPVAGVAPTSNPSQFRVPPPLPASAQAATPTVPQAPQPVQPLPPPEAIPAQFPVQHVHQMVANIHVTPVTNVVNTHDPYAEERLRRQEQERRRQQLERDEKPDFLSIISIGLGVLSLASLFMCFCGGSFVAAPLACAGLVTGFLASGRQRLNGILLNGLALIPGIAVMMFTASLMSMLNFRDTNPVPSTEKNRENTPAPKANTPESQPKVKPK